ncbi:Fic family protein [Scandinavium lactucae]|uniref:Cell filamentation protein Fic n=1 Tax=Scandinavium lactucae TaxID=3095028 RepID=A0ABU4QIV3_9ENTR|nr:MULTISPECIES: cell filamentation protein Fic [unclassified Scandinavium]MDX6038710.1 cell filamentation protein Fic [Scandinavium sp. V105_6]MDX6049334.1 cell filamentation protein Fic [Scandinavium sp. V105_1]
MATELLGLTWDENVLPEVKEVGTRVALFTFKTHMAGFVWDAAQLENNPYTFVEVKTLLDGVTVGGHKVSDTEQVLNLADSGKKLIELVQSGRFDLDKRTFTLLHSIIARNEALEWGVFRGEGEEVHYSARVHLGELGTHFPPMTEAGAQELNRIFIEGVSQIKMLDPFEGALAMFLFGAYFQFFFDGNKRTSRHMMNGWLMQHGYNPISIPAARALEFNSKMVRFYHSKNASEMMAFLADCYQP